MNIQETIKARLIEAGTPEEFIEFREKDSVLRIGYWQEISLAGWNAIKEYVTEDMYEDEDDFGGRPYYRRLYSYPIKKELLNN